jgi:hypothetical protein
MKPIADKIRACCGPMSVPSSSKGNVENPGENHEL